MKLKITRSAYDRITAFTQLCPDEISGLGKIEIDSDENFTVTQVEIFEQEVSGTHSTIETKALAKFQSDRVQAGESMKGWTLWWHSHAHMEVFFSGTDTGTINSSREFPYLVSLVVNKKGQSEARLDVFSPVHMFIGLEVEIIEEVNSQARDLCQKEIDEKVKKPVFRYPSAKTYGKMGDWYGQDREEEHNNWGLKSVKRSLPNAGEMTDEALAKWLREGSDGFEREEYFSHKKHLIQSIRDAKTSRKAKIRRKLPALEEQLKEHTIWGIAAGMEIVKESQTTKDKRTSSIPENIPERT